MKKILITGLAFSLFSGVALAGGQMEEQEHKDHQQKEQQEQMGQEKQKQQQTISADKLSSDKIEKIQQELNDQGFNAGSVDGKFGKSTKQALTNFQKEKGLQASGDLNQETLKALGISLEGEEIQAQEKKPSESESQY